MYRALQSVFLCKWIHHLPLQVYCLWIPTEYLDKIEWFLLKKSATMSPVGQYSTLNSPLVILSKTKKCRMSMCHVLRPLEALPFFANRMALWLSWKTALSHTLNTCASRKLQVQMTSGIPSSTPTSSASVELLVLRHCFQDIEYTDLFLSDIVPPVWLLMSGCTANDASIHHLMAIPSSILRVK
jgi:hypothetical protein